MKLPPWITLTREAGLPSPTPSNVQLLQQFNVRPLLQRVCFGAKPDRNQTKRHSTHPTCYSQNVRSPRHFQRCVIYAGSTRIFFQTQNEVGAIIPWTSTANSCMREIRGQQRGDKINNQPWGSDKIFLRKFLVYFQTRPKPNVWTDNCSRISHHFASSEVLVEHARGHPCASHVTRETLHLRFSSSFCFCSSGSNLPIFIRSLYARTESPLFS